MFVRIGRVLDHEVDGRVRQRAHQGRDEVQGGVTHRTVFAAPFQKLGDASHRLFSCLMAGERDVIRDSQMRKRSAFVGAGGRPAQPMGPDMEHLPANVDLGRESI